MALALSSPAAPSGNLCDALLEVEICGDERPTWVAVAEEEEDDDDVDDDDDEEAGMKGEDWAVIGIVVEDESWKMCEEVELCGDDCGMDDPRLAEGKSRGRLDNNPPPPAAIRLREVLVML